MYRLVINPINTQLFQTLKYSGMHKVQILQILPLNVMFQFFKIAHTRLSLSKIVWRQNCFLRAALNRTIYWKM